MCRHVPGRLSKFDGSGTQSGWHGQARLSSSYRDAWPWERDNSPTAKQTFYGACRLVWPCHPASRGPASVSSRRGPFEGPATESPRPCQGIVTRPRTSLQAPPSCTKPHRRAEPWKIPTVDRHVRSDALRGRPCVCDRRRNRRWPPPTTARLRAGGCDDDLPATSGLRE